MVVTESNSKPTTRGPQPLEGIRVLEWSVWQAGPLASAMLGDMGADVIKVEDRQVGDPSRGLEPAFQMSKTPRTSYYEVHNRNKRGISVDLGKPAGRELLHRLASKADVFLTNFRESVVKKYRMDYETLSKLNPGLVYAIISGQGTKGPDIDQRSFDAIGQARSALMSEADIEEPRYIIGGVGDAIPATMCVIGVMSALAMRARDGQGQKVHVSQLASLMAVQSANLALHYVGGFPITPVPRTTPRNPLVNHYKCADSKWIYVCCMEAEKYWPGLCAALDIKHIEKDPRFDTNPKRVGNPELVGILDEAFAKKTREEWVPILKAHDLIFTRVNDLADLKDDEQVKANDYLPIFKHPVYGDSIYPPLPIELSRTPCAYMKEAPMFGQHTEEVIMEYLGCDWDEIGKLKEQDII